MIRASRKAATCKSYPFRPRTKFFPEYVLYHFAFGLQSKYLPRSARSQRELGLAFSPTCIPARISWRSWGKSVQNMQTHTQPRILEGWQGQGSPAGLDINSGLSVSLYSGNLNISGYFWTVALWKWKGKTEWASWGTRECVGVRYKPAVTTAFCVCGVGLFVL